MDEKKRGIAEAAIRTVTRYGIKKTSMTDISFEAGISRQTLYNYFKNKEEIWLTIIEMITNDYIDQIEKGVDKVESMSEKLDVTLHQVVVEPFQILKKAPELHDIIYGFDETTRKALQIADGKFCAMIARLIEPYSAELEAKQVSPAQVAEMVFYSCKSLKQSAKNKQHLLSMTSAMKMSLLSLLGITP